MRIIQLAWCELTVAAQKADIQQDYEISWKIVFTALLSNDIFSNSKVFKCNSNSTVFVIAKNISAKTGSFHTLIDDRILKTSQKSLLQSRIFAKFKEDVANNSQKVYKKNGYILCRNSCTFWLYKTDTYICKNTDVQLDILYKNIFLGHWPLKTSKSVKNGYKKNLDYNIFFDKN